MKIVGQYRELFNCLTQQNIPCGNIYQTEGLAVHVKKHHPDEVYLLEHIPQIIASPDYVGHNPKEKNSIELVKLTGKNEMVCVKMDIKEGYLYVASVFSISQGKLTNRIKSGRLRAIDKY